MEILPDILAPNLKVVFCGVAAGNESARLGCYYADRTNRFWKVLFRIGLTSHQIRPCEFTTVREYGIGLTDIIKDQAGPDKSIDFSNFDPGAFESKILQFSPKALAFNGREAARKFYGIEKVNFGRQPGLVGRTVIFILPSTSSTNRDKTWFEHNHESFWEELADFVSQ